MEVLKEPDFWEGLGLVIVVAIILYRRVPAMLAKMLDERAAVIQKELSTAKQLREDAHACPNFVDANKGGTCTRS